MRAARWTFRRRLAYIFGEQLVPGKHYRWKARA